jgi:uncharacterized integral membrane protein (TIGR00697 family)
MAHLESQYLSRQANLFTWLTSASVACLVIANVIGVKLFSYDLGSFKVEHTAGMLTFPITFLITDLINEYYGSKAARRVAIISFVMGLLVFAVIRIAQSMPYLDAPFNVSQQAFDQILGSSAGMYLASVTAFLIGSLADITLFGWIKRLTGTKYVWLRATGSTVVSQMLDSFVVTYLAFSLFRRVGGGAGAEPMPFDAVLKTAATGYILKFVISLALTPAIYAGRAMIRKYFNMQPLPPE